MSKKICSLLIVLGTAIPVFAQKHTISVFVKPNYAFPSIENSLSQVPSVAGGTNPSIVFIPANTKRSSKGKLGLKFGVDISFDFSEKFSLKTGLAYSWIRYNEKKEYELDISTPNDEVILSLENDGFDYVLKYLNLPVTANYMFSKKIGAFSGVDFSYLVGSSRQYDQLITNGIIGGETSYVTVESNDKSGDGLNNFVFGVVGGLEYLILKKLTITIEYNRSLSNIYKDTNTLFTNIYKAKGNILSFGITYQIKK